MATARGTTGNTNPDTNLQTMLEADGYNVTVSDSFPSSLAP